MSISVSSARLVEELLHGAYRPYQGNIGNARNSPLFTAHHNYQSIEDSEMKYQELVEELAHSIITIQRVQPREPSTQDTNKKERAKLVKMEHKHQETAS